MDYLKIYNDFISNRKIKQTVSNLYETHHIIPRSLGGTDDANNLIKLTPEEHFFAHRLLAKIYGGTQILALNLMIGDWIGRGNNKLFGFERRKAREVQSKSKLDMWAKKKGYTDYLHQCQHFWDLYVSGKSIADIEIEINTSEATVGRAIKYHAEINNLTEQLLQIRKSRRSEISRNRILNESPDKRKIRMNACFSNGGGWKSQKTGENNPIAKRIVFDGIEYGSIVDAVTATGIPHHTIRNKLKKLNNENFKYVEKENEN